MPMPTFRIAFNKFLTAWFLSGLLTFVVPLITMGSARARRRRQQQYNYDDGQQQQQDGQQDNQYYNNCKWYQWGCSNNYYGEEGQDREEEQYVPWWWIFGNEERRRRREEEGRANPILIFTYIWSLLVFCGILYFGYREIVNKADLHRVVAALAVFANLTFLMMFLLGGLEGGVQTEGRELEEQGFYSQFGVMMFLTSLLWTIFAVTFSIIFYLKAKRGEKIEVQDSDYSLHTPETTKQEQVV